MKVKGRLIAGCLFYITVV